MMDVHKPNPSGHLGGPLPGALWVFGSLRRLLQDHLGLPLRVGAAGSQLLGQQLRTLVHTVLIRTDGGACVTHSATVREVVGVRVSDRTHGGGTTVHQMGQGVSVTAESGAPFEDAKTAYAIVAAASLDQAVCSPPMHIWTCCRATPSR